jgi:hypothetical protein
MHCREVRQPGVIRGTTAGKSFFPEADPHVTGCVVYGYTMSIELSVWLVSCS